MFIRKALRWHFDMPIGEFGGHFEAHEQARLRHIAWLIQLGHGPTPQSLQRKIMGNFGISEEQASYWLKRFEEVGDLNDFGVGNKDVTLRKRRD